MYKLNQFKFSFGIEPTTENTDLVINTKMRTISPTRKIAPPPAEPAIMSKKRRKRVFTFVFVNQRS